VTFNGHRIHYDYPYVTGTEGYSGLVVHGPLIATLSLRAFCRAHPLLAKADASQSRYRSSARARTLSGNCA
jgi:hydroxyacyl-ACP dehydratase HTD2-like protein with hotdog domain